MLQCPICQTEYVEGAVAHCSTCGWDFKQYSLTPEGIVAAQQSKITWAREIWKENQRLKQELSKYVFHEEKLVSSLEIDYKKLRDLLLKKQWRDADQETASLMFRVVGRERKSFTDKLDFTDLREFPCEDLSIIDGLWLKYSKGKFGFSVQSRIQKESEKKRSSVLEVAASFEGRVGWKIGKNIFQSRYLKYNELTFDNEGAPNGHLPAFFIDWEIVTYTKDYYDYGDPPQRHHWLLSNGKYLFKRCEECNLPS
jgi:hypothetical protein